MNGIVGWPLSNVMVGTEKHSLVFILIFDALQGRRGLSAILMGEISDMNRGISACWTQTIGCPMESRNSHYNSDSFLGCTMDINTLWHLVYPGSFRGICETLMLIDATMTVWD